MEDFERRVNNERIRLKREESIRRAKAESERAKAEKARQTALRTDGTDPYEILGRNAETAISFMHYMQINGMPGSRRLSLNSPHRSILDRVVGRNEEMTVRGYIIGTREIIPTINGFVVG